MKTQCIFQMPLKNITAYRQKITEKAYFNFRIIKKNPERIVSGFLKELNKYQGAKFKVFTFFK